MPSSRKHGRWTHKYDWVVLICEVLFRMHLRVDMEFDRRIASRIREVRAFQLGGLRGCRYVHFRSGHKFCYGSFGARVCLIKV